MLGATDAASWPEAFPQQYRAKAVRNWDRDRRRRQREADRARRQRPGRAPVADRLWLAELAQARGADRRAAVAQRSHRGLVSDRHAILQHFVAILPRAPRLLTGDHPGEARPSNSKLLALDDAYVHGDPRMLGTICIPIPGTFPGGFDGLRAAIVGLGCPEPCLAVGDEDAAGMHDLHAFWLIAEPVSATGKARMPPRWLYDLTRRALAEKLHLLGADPAGLGPGFGMKNPLSPRWSHRVMAERPYTLQPDPRPGASGFTALEPLLDLAGVRDRLRAAKKAAWARASRPPPLAPEDRRAALVAGGRKGGQKGGKAGPASRGAATLAAVIEALRRLSAGGRRPTQAEVAAMTGRCRRTIQNHWDAALATVAEGAIKASAIGSGKACLAPPPPASPVGAIPEVPEVHGSPEQSALWRAAAAAGGPSGALGGGGPRPCRPPPERPLASGQAAVSSLPQQARATSGAGRGGPPAAAGGGEAAPLACFFAPATRAEAAAASASARPDRDRGEAGPVDRGRSGRWRYRV